MTKKELPGARYRHLAVPPVIDSCPAKPYRTPAVEYDNFNKRKSLKRDTLLSPGHRMKIKELPY